MHTGTVAACTTGIAAKSKEFLEKTVDRWKYFKCHRSCEGQDELAAGCNYIQRAQDHDQDRTKGRVKHGDKPGSSTYLTSAEEELEAFLMEVAKVGYGKTRRGKIDSWSSGKREGGLAGWEHIRRFHCFLEKRPNLSLRRGDATANVRMEALGIEKMNEYFKSLEETLKQHNLMNYPAQIYNVDETGVPLDHRL